jgi:hypothetical protein
VQYAEREVTLKGSDDGVIIHFEESCCRTLSMVQCFSLKTFRRLALLPSSGWGEGVAPTLWGPLERASLNHWTPLELRRFGSTLVTLSVVKSRLHDGTLT